MDNIVLVTEVEMTFWPDSCAYNSYLRAYENGKPYWLVYQGNQVVGMSGIYAYPELGEPETAWLGWFGVLDEYRGRGYGREILEKTPAIAKSRGYTKFRLYSSRREDLCPNAVPFYEKISAKHYGFVEDYTLEQPEMKLIVVSFSLDGKEISKWNNRNLRLNEDRIDEDDGYQKYLQAKTSMNDTKYQIKIYQNINNLSIIYQNTSHNNWLVFFLKIIYLFFLR